MVTRAEPTREEVLRILGEVMDPEVPVVSCVELGIVRDVAIASGRVTITVTPTYSGCPAMHVIEEDMRAALNAHGIGDVTVETVYSPAWTTDWIGAAAREKLRRFGIAPPGRAEQGGLVTIEHRRAAVPCPYCGSHDTTLRSEFGSTACKAIHFCNACQQPFDEFKSF
ncbi:MAG: 1,2-phenylacetyl-CoA epoxidase subunit PaaD [Gemmatimonadales bacterium]